MKATKYEIYVPTNMRQAVLQYLQRHVLMFYMDEHYLCVIAQACTFRPASRLSHHSLSSS